VLSVAWLWSQHNEIARRTDEIARLRADLAAADSAEPSEAPRALLAPLPTKRPDARQVARDYARYFSVLLAGEGSDLRMDIACSLAIARFTPEECEAALDELDHLGLSDRALFLVKTMMSTTMVGIAPDIVFNHYLNPSAQDRPQLPPPSHFFTKWTDRDPLAAAAWMDEAIETGMFAVKRLDGKYDKRASFEEILVRSLIANHPHEAEARLACLTVPQRVSILAKMFQNCPESQRSSVLAIIERQAPDPATREEIINPPEGSP